MMKKIKIQDNFFIGEDSPLTVISGPCVIEGEDHAMRTADFLHILFSKANIQWIYKSSYDKANRSSIHSYRGPGIEEGLKILEKVKNTFGIPVFTDVHSPEEAREAAEVCSVIQIPAFLCRQTDLLVAAGKTKAVVNVKKGQFMAPWDMQNVVEKLLSTGKDQILLTDRGTTFGYNNLVSDMRSIPILQSLGFPVFYDATHSVQLPGGNGFSSGGQREFVPILSRAALAAGCNGIYAEAHPSPKEAKSDGESVLDFKDLPLLVETWKRIYDVIRIPPLVEVSP
jgi:2-dehydro-3-deoxyphosphooctonate aldolase (KDO 8-P synthase)